MIGKNILSTKKLSYVRVFLCRVCDYESVSCTEIDPRNSSWRIFPPMVATHPSPPASRRLMRAENEW